MSVGKRLYQLFQSVASDQIDAFEDLLSRGSRTLDEKLTEWEREYDSADSGNFHQKKAEGTYSRSSSKPKNQSTKTYSTSPYPQQVVENLQSFGLTPPSSQEEVKKTRNNEIKKYHPDHFNADPGKKETAKKILQIYNLAYDRLRKYYQNQTK